MIDALPTASTPTPRRRALSSLSAGLLAIAGTMFAVTIIATGALLVLAAGALIFGSALLDLV